MKIAIYARISTDNLGQDVDRQLHEVRAYCERMEYCLSPLKLCQYLLTKGVVKNGTETIFG